MNDLLARVTADMKTALKAGEKDRLQVLRLTIAALKDAQLHQESDDMTVDQEQDVLRRMVKARRDSVEQAEKVGRQEIAEREAAEIEVLQSYLPAMMASDELAEKVKNLAAEIGFDGPKDTGRFMKEWMSRYKGLAEGRDVQAALRSLAQTSDRPLSGPARRPSDG